ncbi:MAG: hypothetical protein AB7O24_04575 [Kofleriaceae bacterium]
MNQRWRIALIFGVLGAVLIGGGVYFFKVYGPAKAREEAQAEIANWEERLAAANTCLFGGPGMPVRPAEALAIRKLAPDPWSQTKCAQLIGVLARGPAPDTGMPEVEAAWVAVERAISEVTKAFVDHVDPTAKTSGKHPADSVSPAFDALAKAHAVLRTAAGLEPAPRRVGAPLPPAEIAPVMWNGEPVLDFVAKVPSVNGLVGHADLAPIKPNSPNQRGVHVVLTAGAAAKLVPANAAVVRAVPDSSWGAEGSTNALEIGAVSSSGALNGTTSLKLHGSVGALLAIGKPTDGAIIYGATRESGDYVIAFARAMGGSFKAEREIDVSRYGYAVEPSGRAVFAWGDDNGVIRGEILHGGHAAKRIEIGSGMVNRACLTATRAWIAGAGQFISFDDAGGVPHMLTDHMMIGCTERAMLAYVPGSTRFAVCTDACRVATVNTRPSQINPATPGPGPAVVATVVGDRVTVVDVQDRVLGVMSETAPPRFYLLPTAVRPDYVISDGRMLEVIASDDGKTVIVRVPAIADVAAAAK